MLSKVILLILNRLLNKKENEKFYNYIKTAINNKILFNKYKSTIARIMLYKKDNGNYELPHKLFLERILKYG